MHHTIDDRYYTPQDLAARWKCNINTLYEMLRKGKLQGFKIGRDWRISERAVIAYETDPGNQLGITYQCSRRSARKSSPMRLV